MKAMTKKWNTIASAVVVGITCLALAALLLSPEPQAAWNSGARDRLSEALKAIGYNLYLAQGNERDGPHKLDARDFIPRSREQKVDPLRPNGRSLVEQHGVSVRWRQNRVWKTLLFYPIALSQKIVIEPQSNAEPTPQVVMVPIDEEDIETLPNLSGCQDVNAKTVCQCQFHRMKVLFSEHGIEYAITLRSDGSAWALPVDELCSPVPGTQEQTIRRANTSTHANEAPSPPSHSGHQN
jgi:hypothetical protein